MVHHDSHSGKKISRTAAVWIAVATFVLGGVCGATPVLAQYRKLDRNFVTMFRTCNASNASSRSRR